MIGELYSGTALIPYARVTSVGVVVITIAQIHSAKPELRFCADSNPAPSVSEIRYGEDF